MAVLGELMSRNLLAVAPEDTLGEAAERMTDEGVGSAVVLDGGRLIGILTERDVLRAVAGRVHSSDARVREWMTEDPIVAGEETTAAESLETMMMHGFRHLPIVEDGRVVGIVSMRDVMAASVRAVPGVRLGSEPG
jgi:CBS domain-containing protein